MSCVVSVEQVVISFNDTDLVKSAFLSKGQTFAQCVPMFQSMLKDDDSTSFDGYADASMFMVTTLPDTGSGVEVRIERDDDRITSAEVSVYVIEFINDINITHYTGSTTNYRFQLPIAAVDRTHGFASTSLITTYADYREYNAQYLLYFGSDTTFRIYRLANASATINYSVYIVEDSTAGTHFATQQKTISMGDATQKGTGIVTGLDRDKTFIIPSHYAEGSTGAPQYYFVRWFFQGDSNCVGLRGAGGAGKSIFAAVQFVELQADDAKVVRSLNTMASGVDHITPLAESPEYPDAADLGANCAAWSPSSPFACGNYSLLTTRNQYATSQTRVELRDVNPRTVLDITRNSNTAGAINLSWEVVDFGGGEIPRRRIFIT